MWDNYEGDVESVSITRELKLGSYGFQLTDIVVKTDFKDTSVMAGQKAYIFKLEVIEAEDENEGEIGKGFDDFLRDPNPSLQGKDSAETFASILKSHLLWYGVPESLINDRSFDLDDEDDRAKLIGLVGWGTISKNKKGYVNLTSFKVEDDLDGGAEDDTPALDIDSLPVVESPKLGKW